MEERLKIVLFLLYTERVVKMDLKLDLYFHDELIEAGASIDVLKEYGKYYKVLKMCCIDYSDIPYFMTMDDVDLDHVLRAFKNSNMKKVKLNRVSDDLLCMSGQGTDVKYNVFLVPNDKGVLENE